MERFKRRINLLCTDFKYTYYHLAAGDTTCLSRGDVWAAIIGILATVFVFFTKTAYAGGLLEDAGDVAESISNEFTTQVTKFAGLALGACIIWFFMCTSDEDAKRPLKWGKRIIIAYVIFRLIGPILTFIDDHTKDA